MIPLGLRLLFQSGREALWRLLAIVGGVAIGVALLLAIMSGFTGLGERESRISWLQTEGSRVKDMTQPVPADALLWDNKSDRVQGTMINRVDVAGGNGSVRIPGVGRIPAAGEYYVSPALATLIAQHPKDQLADRFGTKQIGVISKEALGSSNELTVISGQTEATFRERPNVQAVTRINTETQSPDGQFMRMVLAIGAAGIIFPTAMFVAVSTRLAAARREERFAAIRLVGGTKRQVVVLAAIETGVGALLGIVLGSLLYLPFPYILSRYELVGIQFYPEYLSVTPVQYLAVTLGVLAAAIGISFFALRKIDASPLGVARKAPAKPPRSWRVIPLALGLAAAWYMAYQDNDAANELTMIGTLLLCGIGVFLIGPWLAVVTARLMKRFDTGAAGLIAGSRLLTQPSSIFRAVSGVVIAIFVVSVFNAIATGYITASTKDRTSVLPAGTVSVFVDGPGLSGTLRVTKPGTNPAERSLERMDAIAAALDADTNVTDIATLYSVPSNMKLHDVTVQIEGGSKQTLTPDMLMSCATATTYGFKGCPRDKYIAVPEYSLLERQPSPPEGWQYVQAARAELTPARLLVGSDGSRAAIEHIRTTAIVAANDTIPVMTDQEFYATSIKMFTQLRAITNLGMLIVLLVAGCSLLVAVADSLLERKRPFTLLRLTGMSLRQLRLAVMLEATIPLTVTAIVAATIGTLYGGLLLKATADVTLVAPTLTYILTIVGGIVLSLAIVACTLPLLGNLSKAENARFE
jgi:hypothetical protein